MSMLSSNCHLHNPDTQVYRRNLLIGINIVPTAQRHNQAPTRTVKAELLTSANHTWSTTDENAPTDIFTQNEGSIWLRLGPTLN